jgi:hypothetical protein
MSAFLGELLAGEEAWKCTFGRTRYVRTGKPTAEERERFAAALGEGTQPLSTRLYHTLRASRFHAATAQKRG